MPITKAAEAACKEFWRVLGIKELTLEHAWNAADAAFWQSMDTAPKDDTIIDVWLGDASEEDVAFYCTPGTRRSCGWAWRDGKYRPLGGLKTSMPTFVQPTHWRLPPRGPA